MRKLLFLLVLAVLTCTASRSQTAVQCLVGGVWVPCSMAPQPQFAQTPLSAKTGSTAPSLTVPLANATKGNTLVVVFAYGNNNTPTVSDSPLNLKWFKATQSLNGSAFQSDIYYAPNTSSMAGADSVTVNAGANTAIAMTVYEVPGLVYPAAASSPTSGQSLDQIAQAAASGATSPPVSITPIVPNEYVFVGFGLGNAQQQINVNPPYNNDSGQQNPTTGSGLFSFVAASLFKPDMTVSSPSATATSEPWAVSVASFKTLTVPVQGTMQGMGTAGTPSGGVLTVQGISGGTAIPQNAAQFGGNNVVTGTGASGLGIPRVTISNDSSLAANQSVNVSQWNGQTAAQAANGIPKVGIVGNAAATLDQTPGSAAPANALQIGVTDGTNTRVPYLDPCGFSASTYYVINVLTNTQIVAGSSGKNVYICKLFLAPVAAPANVNIVEGSGSTCATSTAGMMGGSTTVLGAQLSANGGFVLPADQRAWMKTATSGDAVCVFTSAQVTGVVAYVQV